MLHGHEETGEGIVEGMGMRRLARACDMFCNFTDVLWFLVTSPAIAAMAVQITSVRCSIPAGMVHNMCLWDVGGQPAR
jgi:hypothetical protein